MTSNSRWVALITLTAGLACPGQVQALTEQGTYTRTTKVEPDSEAGGWFINLGITGARGKLTPDAPKVMEVAYVFKGTPADGVLEAGDRIVGANGERFRTAHKFGYGMDKFGYEGPMMDIGNALEASQGAELEGKLTFDIVRGEREMTVELQLPTEYGQFSEAYPFECAKTDRILEDLYKYLADRQRENGAWSNGRPHIDAFAALALLASGDTRYRSSVKKAMRFFAEETDTEIHFNGGYDCWKYGLFGVCLAEYHLATGEKWVLPELEEINGWLVATQFDKPYRNGKGTGGWGHRPAFRPEGNGYGPICMITAQALAAWGLIGQCGIEIDRQRYDLAHEFLAKGTNDIGYVWYADGNGGDSKYADMGRTGGAAAAHAVSPFEDSGLRRYALKTARCIGEHTNTFTDTHGSPVLGIGWTALGAAVDDESFRNLMDDHVWHFNLAHCPDGTFYYQPNRDNNPQDYTAAPRLSATAATALVLSIKHRSLRITGGTGASGAAGPAGGLSRTWHTFHNPDRTRSFEAELLAFDPKTNQVTIRYRDGRVVAFELDKLSEEDAEFVRANSPGSGL